MKDQEGYEIITKRVVTHLLMLYNKDGQYLETVFVSQEDQVEVIRSECLKRVESVEVLDLGDSNSTYEYYS